MGYSRFKTKTKKQKQTNKKQNKQNKTKQKTKQKTKTKNKQTNKQTKKTTPPYRWWNSRLFSTFHGKEFQPFSLFLTPLYLSIPDFQKKKSPIPDFYHIKSWNSTFHCYFLCEMLGFPDLFYKNLIWDSSQHSNLVLDFQFFSEIEKNTLYKGWSVQSGTAQCVVTATFVWQVHVDLNGFNSTSTFSKKNFHIALILDVSLSDIKSTRGQQNVYVFAYHFRVKIIREPNTDMPYQKTPYANARVSMTTFSCCQKYHRFKKECKVTGLYLHGAQGLW